MTLGLKCIDEKSISLGVRSPQKLPGPDGTRRHSGDSHGPIGPHLFDERYERYELSAVCQGIFTRRMDKVTNILRQSLSKACPLSCLPITLQRRPTIISWPPCVTGADCWPC
jgi:hypothetical protein